MQTITAMEQAAALTDNRIIGNFDFIRSQVVFKGSGNVLIAPGTEKITLSDTTIAFNNDNSIVFLNRSNKNYMTTIYMHNNSTCYIGANNYFNGNLTLQCSEQCNIVIGDDCLFSFGIWVRTSDVHLIYDIESRKRINRSQSVFIGDHVWVGQDTKILKGTQIGSGAILGANALSTGKRIPSNTIWGGNPARLIKRGVFFLGNSAHPYTDAETEKWSEYTDDQFIYKFDASETLDFIGLEREIQSFHTAQERAAFLLDFSSRKAKNRCYIAEPVDPEKGRKLLRNWIDRNHKRG